MTCPTDEGFFDPICPVCGEVVAIEICWYCHGDGGFHDCGEDCCCCLDPEDDLNEWCPECEGHGEYSVCPNAANHPDAVATEGEE